MFLLGRQLPDGQKVFLALTEFYGISYYLSSRLCARLQLHEKIRVGDLTDRQVTQMSAYLSAPGSIPILPPQTARAPSIAGEDQGQVRDTSAWDVSASAAPRSNRLPPPSQRPSPSSDPLRSIVLEGDLRRAMQANIAHHRNVGSYKGRRHQQGLPVRGQRTRSNGLTAKKLNKVDRRNFVTLARDVMRGGDHVG